MPWLYSITILYNTNKSVLNGGVLNRIYITLLYTIILYLIVVYTNNENVKTY